MKIYGNIEGAYSWWKGPYGQYLVDTFPLPCVSIAGWYT